MLLWAIMGGVRWIARILYVEDLCLISTDALKLQMMINTCQTLSEKARMQLNADKTKIMCFPHKPEMCENDHDKLMAALFGQRHSTSYPCTTQTTPTPPSLPILYIHTTARGKAIWLSWSPTRPHGEYESCCVIHPRKGKQSSLSCPHCLLFPPLRQAPGSGGFL